jgi:hypothetical protein
VGAPAQGHLRIAAVLISDMRADYDGVNTLAGRARVNDMAESLRDYE